MYKLLLLLILASPIFVHAQSRKEKKAMEARLKADQEILNRIKTHVQFLAANDLEGRKAGSRGETVAKDYIVNEFKNIGLAPGNKDGYTQEFVIEEGKKIDAATHFILNEKKLDVMKDYFPLPYSANKTVTGSPAIDLREGGEPWFADIKDWIDSINPLHLHEAIKKEVTRVAGKGATALVLFNSGSHDDPLVFDKKDSTPASTIPIIYLTKQGFTKYVTDRSALQDIDLNIAVKESNSKGVNVVGYIDNGMSSTVVIAAHYDHLGKLANNGQATDSIYNGADDNASGTAALIELARMLKQSTAKSNNYLFIALSGSETGHHGSKYWLEHNAPSNINYMINMDMIGRYDAVRKLTIAGVNTSAFWNKALAKMNDNAVAVKVDSTVTSGDHIPFVKKNIPALYFYTGNHNDYHKPGDEADKLNYDGELKILKYINRLVAEADGAGALAFTKPVETAAPAGRFTVSLGVIPDNAYQGKGFKIGGVSPKRLADKIGLKAGDILLQLGDYEINEMSSYMKALSMFKQGDNTTLKLLRGTDEKQIDVSF